MKPADNVIKYILCGLIGTAIGMWGTKAMDHHRYNLTAAYVSKDLDGDGRSDLIVKNYSRGVPLFQQEDGSYLGQNEHFKKLRQALKGTEEELEVLIDKLEEKQKLLEYQARE